MLQDAYRRGYAAALAHFKVANMMVGAGGAYSPAVSGQAQPAAAAMPATLPKPPSPPNAPVAASAAKSNILG